jgi:hypothetical protein
MASGTSYNGWPASDNKAEINVQPFGDAVGLPFPGGVKGGDVTTVLGYVAIQLHERVEPCVAGWDWGHSYKQNVNNPLQLSCHASGTAIDYNAPNHPNGSSGTFSDAQRGTIYAILNEVQGAVDWLEGYDEMHFEITVSAAELAPIAASLGSITPEDDEMDAQQFKQFMNDWYENEPVVKLNNGEQTTMKQFVINLDQRTWTTEQAAKQELGQS